MYMLDEQTPIKDISEFGYPVCNVVGIFLFNHNAGLLSISDLR